MVDTLKKYFPNYAIEDVVEVEVTTHGLWLVSQNRKMRHFLGLARKPDENVIVPMQHLNFFKKE